MTAAGPTGGESGGNRFAEKCVIVTGGTTGIGFAVAEAFARERASVALCGRTRERADEAAAKIADRTGAVALGIPADVSDARDVEAMFEAVEQSIGGVDILVNNAGIATHALVSDMSEEEFDRVMAVNVKGVFLCSRQMVRRAQAARRPGAIVNVASQAGKRGYPFVAHYCASKGAVLLFTRALAKEASPLVRVYAVCPGIVETDMMRRGNEWRATVRDDEVVQELQRQWRAAMPSGRPQAPTDIAPAVLFLASEDNGQTIGEALNVSAGMVME